MYLASPRTSSSWAPFKESFTGRIGSYGCFYGFLYGYGLQSILLCVLTAALSVTSTPGYLLASSLYAALPIVLTIVHFDGTSILSLHSMNRTLILKVTVKGDFVLVKKHKAAVIKNGLENKETISIGTG
jgi:hypothetical protein